jgi:AbrB family looped-hinge helix DNA binding protein
MAENKVKVSGKYQIVVPKEARKALNVQPGDYLLTSIEDGVLILRPRPKSYTRAMRGLHKDLWQDSDVENYIKQERKSWR